MSGERSGQAVPPIPQLPVQEGHHLFRGVGDVALRGLREKLARGVQFRQLLGAQDDDLQRALLRRLDLPATAQCAPESPAAPARERRSLSGRPALATLARAIARHCRQWLPVTNPKRQCRSAVRHSTEIAIRDRLDHDPRQATCGDFHEPLQRVGLELLPLGRREQPLAAFRVQLAQGKSRGGCWLQRSLQVCRKTRGASWLPSAGKSSASHGPRRNASIARGSTCAPVIRSRASSMACSCVSPSRVSGGVGDPLPIGELDIRSSIRKSTAPDSP